MGGAIEELARAALAEAGGGLGLAGRRQLIDLEVERGHDAVDVKFNALGFAAAVVGQEDMLPGILFGDGLSGGHLDGVDGPLANQVETIVGVGEEERPALRGLRVVHAGDEGLCPHHGAGTEPAADGEGLLCIEVADVTELEVSAFFDSEGGPAAAFFNPGGGSAVDLGLCGDAGAFIQGETTQQALRRDVLVEVRGLEFSKPTFEVLAGDIAKVAGLLLGGFDFSWQCVPARTVGVGRQVNHRAAAVLHVAVEAGLGRVAEEGG